uniref:tumor necrosis factor receptor superfamily member 1A n=1 Tax=Semicossyphus pulcher TaxID=241346 RepID=UPI0037E877BD
MEGGVHRGRWSKKAPVGTILLLMCMFIPTLTMLQPSEEQKCPHGDYPAGNGVCCNKCSPGFKLVEKCHASNERSNCTPCPESQFTDQMNYFPNCMSCKFCKKSRHEKEVLPCERHRNTVCRCEDSYYRSYIDSETYECLKCAQCRPGETEKQTCTPERNTVCECRDNYYRVGNKCELCKTCSAECKHLCSSPSISTKAPELGEKYLIHIIVVAAAVALVILGLGVVVTHIVTKWSTKNKLLKSSSETSEDSQDSLEQGLMFSEKHSNDSVEAVPQSPVSDQEPSNLPDCVPLEIKIPDLIYTVLDLVPVYQVKQLMRSLGVRDSEISHAELDHRSSKEAHYQMLRVWAEMGSGSGGGVRGGMLHMPLLQELLDKLREMHLGRAAEELETKYSIQ